MRRRLLRIMVIVGLFFMMLSGCAAGTPVVATMNTEREETESEMKTDTGSVSASEQESGNESTSSAESDASTESQTEEQTESEEPTEPLTEESTESESTETLTEEPTEPLTEEPTEPEVKVPTYYIKVDRRANCVTIYEQDSSGEYTIPVKYMICSVGAGRRTPTGVFAISDQYRWRALFSNAYGQYASRITGHILFHSVPYLVQSSDTLIPGTYNQLGTKASQGCVRLTCIDAKWIYDNCPPGTVVEIYDGSTTTVPERPTALRIDSNSPYSGWDPTDPNPANPWKTVPITINGVVDMTVECGSEADLLSHVSALDIDGSSPLSVSVQGTVNVNRCGTYKVIYSAVGAIGTTASVEASVTVVPAPETEAMTESERPAESEPLSEPEWSTESESSSEPEMASEELVEGERERK